MLYVGDFDPCGMFMSEQDLPDAARRIRRRSRNGEADCADAARQVGGLPSFPATDKKKDPRYNWFVGNYGARCWELDAMDPNDLRDCVEEAIVRVDRARGVGTLRDRQPGRAGIAADDPRKVEGRAMSLVTGNLRAPLKARGMDLLPDADRRG